MTLPLNTRFTLGSEITAEQQDFLDQHGFLVFSQVASQQEVETILAEIAAIEGRWLDEGRTKVNGIPITVGKGPDGGPFIQRLAFTSMFSPQIAEFVRQDRFAPIRGLVGKDTRVGDNEKDGVVVNRYINVPGTAHARLGWHTDGLRDLFYGRMPKQMLNVGLHFDRIKEEDGGLRVIPGTHRQGFLEMLARKPYFVSHKADPKEHVIETEVGDMTVHDGRLWHRVEASPHVGLRSLRRSMYVPYLTDEYEPKNEQSKTPAYHYLNKAFSKLKSLRSQLTGGN